MFLQSVSLQNLMPSDRVKINQDNSNGLPQLRQAILCLYSGIYLCCFSGCHFSFTKGNRLLTCIGCGLISCRLSVYNSVHSPLPVPSVCPSPISYELLILLLLLINGVLQFFRGCCNVRHQITLHLLEQSVIGYPVIFRIKAYVRRRLQHQRRKFG